MEVVRPEVEFNVGGRGGDEQEQGRDRKFPSLFFTQLQCHYKNKKRQCHKCGLAPCGICLNVSQPYPGQGQVSLCREGIFPVLCLWQDESLHNWSAAPTGGGRSHQNISRYFPQVTEQQLLCPFLKSWWHQPCCVCQNTFLDVR